MTDMIRIFPEIDFQANCPHDHAALRIINIAIPGMRCLADAVCPNCQTRYYIDLPVGQALWVPFMLNQANGHVCSARILNERDQSITCAWFRDPLQESFLHPLSTEIVPIVHKFFEAERIVLINCLDFLYGHSLLKLLNVQRYLDHTPELGCCVLAPTPLVHLVPEGVAEIWEFPMTFRDGLQWYPSLQKWITNRLSGYKECFLSPAYSHPSPRTYTLQRFVKQLPDISSTTQNHHPIILFSYREDRLWGHNLLAQQVNLQMLYTQLSKIFPDMAFVLVGFGQQHHIQSQKAMVIDLRTSTFTVEQDRLWLAYMQHADCVIGVHGSNMLLPSGLAKTTVELMPRTRIGSAGQDLLFSQQCHPLRNALLYCRIIHGDEFLSDVAPSIIVDVITTLLSYSQWNSLWFQFGENDHVSADQLDLIYNGYLFTQHENYFKTTTTNSLLMRIFRHVIENLTQRYKYVCLYLRQLC